jgi:signal peptidase II
MDRKVKGYFRSVLIVIVLASNVGCDQMSKNFFRMTLDFHEPVTIIKDRVTLMKIENTGAFLSLGASLPEPLKAILLTGLPVVILTLAILFLFKRHDLSLLSMLGTGFIVGGGIGNIYDRIMYGSVTDFLHIDFGIFETGVFNMADVSIMSGIGMVLFDLFFNDKETSAAGLID